MKKVLNKGIMDMELSKTKPYYSRWQGMLGRCYNPKFHIKNPAYKNCWVCDEWLYFSNFYEWMRRQNWKGLQIDKNILKPNNLVYSPHTCCFVPKPLNILFSNGGNKQGRSLPKGVYYYPSLSQEHRYTSTISKYGKSIPLGSYETKFEAERAYHLARISYIKEWMVKQSGVVKIGMQKHIDQIHLPKIKELDEKIAEYYINPPERETKRKNLYANLTHKEYNALITLRKAIQNFYGKRHTQNDAVGKLKDKIPKLRVLNKKLKQQKNKKV